MPEPKVEETVVSTPSTQKAAEEAGIPESKVIAMLQAGIDQGVDAALKRFEGRRTTERPSMAGAADDPDQVQSKAWEITHDDSERFKKAKSFLPAGTTHKLGGNQRNAIFEDIDRNFYRKFDMNTMPKGDIEENFSILRLVQAQNAARNGDPHAWERYAPWETAYYDAVRKAQAESNGQDGGFLAPETWVNQLFGVLRPASILEKLPITTMSVSTRVQHIPRVTGDITIGYTAENGALTASTFQFSQSNLTIRKQSAFIQVSNELMRDSLPDAENAIRTEAALAIARDRDKQVLLGNGQAGAPTGLQNMTNMTSTALGATPTYINLHTGILNVENLNGSTNVPVGEASCTGVLGSVQLKHTIYKLVDVTVGRPIMWYGLQQSGASGVGPAGPVGGDGGLNGLLGVPNWVFSNLLPIGSGGVIFYGDWRWLVLAVRQDVEVMASNVAGTAFQNDQTWIRLIYRYDTVAVHPEAFFVHTTAAA